MQQAENNKIEKQVPPYLAYSRFQNFIVGLRQIGLPHRVDRSLMPRFSGAEQSAILTALRFLHLITLEGKPEKRLDELVAAEGDNWKAVMREAITSSYTFLFDTPDFDVHRGTREQLEEQFREAGISGDTIRKSISFFLEAAKDTGIEVSVYFGAPRPRTQKTQAMRRAKQTIRTSDAVERTDVGDNGEPTISPLRALYQILDPEQMNEEEAQAVWTLIRYLKRQDSPQVERRTPE